MEAISNTTLSHTRQELIDIIDYVLKLAKKRAPVKPRQILALVSGSTPMFARARLIKWNLNATKA